MGVATHVKSLEASTLPGVEIVVEPLPGENVDPSVFFYREVLEVERDQRCLGSLVEPCHHIHALGQLKRAEHRSQ